MDTDRGYLLIAEDDPDILKLLDTTLTFRGYRIVYLLQEDMVFILRVVHGSRDLLGLVRREPWDIGS